MPRACSICHSPQRAEIEAAIENSTLRNVSIRFETSTAALSRHQQHAALGGENGAGELLTEARVLLEKAGRAGGDPGRTAVVLQGLASIVVRVCERLP